MRIRGYDHDDHKHDRGSDRADKLDRFNDAAANAEQKQDAGNHADCSKNDLQIKQK